MTKIKLEDRKGRIIKTMYDPLIKSKKEEIKTMTLELEKIKKKNHKVTMELEEIKNESEKYIKEIQQIEEFSDFILKKKF